MGRAAGVVRLNDAGLQFSTDMKQRSKNIDVPASSFTPT
jgi:hypothetical protein